MIEIERKFILKYLPDKYIDKYIIKQGYLMFDFNKHLRVRVINDTHAVLAYKTIMSSVERLEYEYEIPLEDGLKLLESTEIKLVKTRYVTMDEYSHEVDIDIYDNGLKVVEIEYNDTDFLKYELPDYCGEEITGISKYSNITIAKNNK